MPSHVVRCYYISCSWYGSDVPFRGMHIIVSGRMRPGLLSVGPSTAPTSLSCPVWAGVSIGPSGLKAHHSQSERAAGYPFFCVVFARRAPRCKNGLTQHILALRRRRVCKTASARQHVCQSSNRKGSAGSSQGPSTLAQMYITDVENALAQEASRACAHSQKWIRTLQNA